MGMILDDRTAVAELLAQWYSNRKKVRDVKPEHCKRGMAVSILRWVSSDIRVWIRALSSVISIRHKRIFCGVYFVKVEKEPYQSRGKPFNGGHPWQTRSQGCSKPQKLMSLDLLEKVPGFFEIALKVPFRPALRTGVQSGGATALSCYVR